MERFQFKKKRPYVAHKKVTPLRAPSRSFSESRDDLLRSLNARIPVVLRLDRQHSSGPARSRASSISSLDQYRKGLSNSPRYRAREVTRSLSEDVFGVSPLVITETELSSSWLYKSMKAVANGAEDTEHPTTKPQKALKTSTTEPSLSPIPLKDPKMKPIPVPTRTPRPKSACSRFCYFAIMVLISTCLLGMLSTLGAIIYIELFSNSTITWNAGSLELISRSDDAGMATHDGRYDNRAEVNVQGVPHGYVDKAGRTIHKLRVEDEHEERSHKEIMAPGGKGSQRHRQEVLESEDEEVFEPEVYRHEVQSIGGSSRGRGAEEHEMDDSQYGDFEGSIDERTLGQGLRASEAEVKKHQWYEVEASKKYEGSQDPEENLVKDLAEDEVQDPGRDNSEGKDDFSRRTVHVVDLDYPKPNDLSQFLDNVRTQIRRHMDQSIIHEEVSTSPETEQSVDSTSERIENNQRGDSQVSNESTITNIDSEESEHDELDSAEGVESHHYGEIPPKEQPSPDNRREDDKPDINNSDASDVLETQYQDLFEDGVKDAVTEREDEEANHDLTEARSDQTEHSAFVSGRDAEQFLLGTSEEGANEASDKKNFFESENVAHIVDPPEDLNDHDDDEEGDLNFEDEAKQTSDGDGDEDAEDANIFSIRSGDLHTSSVDEKVAERTNSENLDFESSSMPSVDKLNQFSSRSGDLQFPQDVDEFEEPRVQFVSKRRPPLRERVRAPSSAEDDPALKSVERLIESQITGSQGLKNKRPPLKGNVDAFFSPNAFLVHQRAEALSENRKPLMQATKNRRPPSPNVNRLSNENDFQLPQKRGSVFGSQDSIPQAVRRTRPPTGGHTNSFLGDFPVPNDVEAVFRGTDPRAQAVKGRRPPLPGSNLQHAVGQPEPPRVGIKNSLAEAIKRLTVLDSKKKVVQSKTRQNKPRAEATRASIKVGRLPQAKDAEREVYLQNLKQRFFDEQR